MLPNICKIFRDVHVSGGSYRLVLTLNQNKRGEREFFIENLLVRIQFIIAMIMWTDLAPWESEFPFPGSLASTFLENERTFLSQTRAGAHMEPDVVLEDYIKTMYPQVLLSSSSSSSSSLLSSLA